MYILAVRLTPSSKKENNTVSYQISYSFKKLSIM